MIGIARDLTGAAVAFNNRSSYLMLFEWYYPDNIKVLGTALKIWGHDPDVSTPIIKCKLFFQTLGFRLFLQIITSRYDRTASKSISATSV